MKVTAREARLEGKQLDEERLQERPPKRTGLKSSDVWSDCFTGVCCLTDTDDGDDVNIIANCACYDESTIGKSTGAEGE